MATDTEVLTIEIAKLQLSGGDILVLRPSYIQALSALDLERMAQMLPEGVKVFVVPQDVGMVVMSPSKEMGA